MRWIPHNFLKYKFIYLNWRLITLQFCIGFAIHQHESTMGVHVFPILNLPLHTIPLGHPTAPALSILYHALNLDWRFISYMILFLKKLTSGFINSSLPFPFFQFHFILLLFVLLLSFLLLTLGFFLLLLI